MHSGVRTHASVPALVAAFAIIYFVWGSTYLAIKLAVQTMPPLLMGGTRFMIAGVLLYAFLRLRGDRRPALRDWTSAAIAGALLLLVGIGLVCWAEQWVPSGVTALVIGTTPLWMLNLDWLLFGGPRPSRATLVAMAFGLGALVLIATRQPSGQAMSHVSPTRPVHVLALVGACIGWSSGSLWQRNLRRRPPLMQFSAMQMIVGGILMIAAGAVFGEIPRLRPSAFAWQSLLAYAYLIVIGSWLAFSVYVWLLTAATPTAISTYAFVSPVIAVFLGWLLAREELTVRIILAASLTVGSVVIITLTRWKAAAAVNIEEPEHV